MAHDICACQRGRSSVSRYAPASTNTLPVARLNRRMPAPLAFIEERRLKFALLGSSARKLEAAGVNLLAGRALHRTMHPLTPAELGDDFDLDSALEWGTIPLVWVSDERREVLGSYVQLYLREEIRAEALVRNLPGFARFLPIAALCHGQVVNISGLARDCGVARTTVQGYLDILEDTLLAFRLPAFEARLRVRERRHPKLYWVDPGLVRAVKRQRGPVAPEERGALLAKAGCFTCSGRTARRATCTRISITGRPIPRTAPRWTFSCGAERNSRRSRSSPSRAGTPECCRVCARSPSFRAWCVACSSTAAGDRSAPRTGSRSGPSNACITRWRAMGSGPESPAGADAIACRQAISRIGRVCGRRLCGNGGGVWENESRLRRQNAEARSGITASGTTAPAWRRTR